MDYIPIKSNDSAVTISIDKEYFRKKIAEKLKSLSVNQAFIPLGWENILEEIMQVFENGP